MKGEQKVSHTDEVNATHATSWEEDRKRIQELESQTQLFVRWLRALTTVPYFDPAKNSLRREAKEYIDIHYPEPKGKGSVNAG